MWDIELDDHGYPEEACLSALRNEPGNFRKAALFIIEDLGGGKLPYASASVSEVKEGFTGKPVKKVLFSTGGWSGNEDLMGVLMDRFDVCHFLRQWNAGGHYQFEIPVALLKSDREARL